MSGISTHVLDTSMGRPAAGVGVTLEARIVDGEWRELARAKTNADGRVANLLPAGTSLAAGIYRLRFETGVYFASRDVRAFYPHVEVVFEVHDAAQHYHVPLLVSPFGYSTYRGS
jgi:5-hydroxyisourate hydrolase